MRALPAKLTVRHFHVFVIPKMRERHFLTPIRQKLATPQVAAAPVALAPT